MNLITRLTQIINIIICSLLFIITTTTCAQNIFTQREQRELFTPPSTIFSLHDEISIDVDKLQQEGFCFPITSGYPHTTNAPFIEINSAVGDTVKAMFSGCVRLSRNTPEQGLTVVLRHENYLETVYGNLASLLVKPLSYVKAGTPIGVTGGNGGRIFATFAFMIGGKCFDATQILDLDNCTPKHVTAIFKQNNKQDNNDITLTVKQNKVENSTDFASEIAWKDPGNTLNLKEIPNDKWCFPLPKAKLISPYGRRNGRVHAGMDLKTKPNDSIKAAFDGQVVKSERYYGYGNCIIIRHFNGLETLYGHNSKNLVKVGEYVKAGQIIALTGRTGRASTEHLHFECRRWGMHFNPVLVFDPTKYTLQQHTLTFSRRGKSLKVKIN